MNILFIVHRIPYPPNKGDKIRSFNEIKFLSKEHNLYLAFLVDDKRDVAYIDVLNKYCKGFDYDVINPLWQRIKSIPYLLTRRPLSVPYFYSVRLQGAIDRRLKESQIDTIICFSSPMAEYVFKSRAFGVQNVRSFEDVKVVSNGRSDRMSRAIKQIEQFSRAKQLNNSNKSNIGYPNLIMDFVDVDSDKWRIYEGFSSFPFSVIYRREWKRLMNYEQRIGHIFDWNIFVSEKEVDLFKSFCPEANAISITNGVDFDFHEEVQSVRDVQIDQAKRSNNSNIPNILFMGAMDYLPNEDAVLYFTAEIWPYVKEELPTARFYVVGGKPSRKVIILSEKDPNIVVTGYVPDVRPYLKMADVFVVPLRVARGIQNKVLEAMAAGVPVVARSEAVQGLGSLNGCIMVEDDERRFALSIRKVLHVSLKRGQMVADSKRFILKNHNWQENLSKLEELLHKEV